MSSMILPRCVVRAVRLAASAFVPEMNALLSNWGPRFKGDVNILAEVLDGLRIGEIKVVRWPLLR